MNQLKDNSNSEINSEYEIIRQNVFYYDQDEKILFFKSLPESTLESGKILWQKVDELISGKNELLVILDSADMKKKPDSNYRKFSQKMIFERRKQFKHIAFVIKNPLLVLLVKFIIKPDYGVSYSICKNIDEAVRILSKY